MLKFHEPLVKKKITILGTTGSGKTSFLTALFGDFEKNDVAREVFKEVSANLDFIPLKHANFTSSTTTISLNVINSIIVRTRFNKIIIKKFQDLNTIDFESIDEIYQVIFNDPAGQERFDFMQDIAIKGAHLVIVMADGTNISSIQKIVHYVNMVQLEEQRKKIEIPVIIFVNKADLKSNGVYLGKETAENLIMSNLLDRKITLFETSNIDVFSYEMPLTLILNYLSSKL